MTMSGMGPVANFFPSAGPHFSFNAMVKEQTDTEKTLMEGAE